ncbi:MAG: tRNA (N(6)-L-threonylcarbamoyladenosine(37)-C(2))-methylthiotransferase MtaB [Candidatus Desulfatibia sp.]|uniref:tRNA (N(6)-L-threonylcarbamoyladenosine(37)-C(2))- methylthiotransferase MtaB n=1 Tax=Candidatus Desulfatibia sp. TaxID=3101189 RepID=UPI002F2FF0C2
MGRVELKNKPIDITNRHSASGFTISTLGCKVNQYESDAIAQSLKDTGCILLPGEENADLCIINTCTVTQKAAMQSRQAIRQAIRNHPGARIIVTGCYAQVDPSEIKKIKGVHDIIGHADKHEIPAMIVSTEHVERPHPVLTCREISDERDYRQMAVVAFGKRTRPFLKIQDGCNTFCSYCIVPYARGRSRSMILNSVLENVHKIRQGGFCEVVLTGVHLGAYGLDLTPKTNLFNLLKRIQASTTIERVRLSSIEPLELTRDIIQLVADSNRFCRHFHIPLQSGDDGILKNMNRPYTRSFFRDLVLKINTLIPDAAIGVDTLVGFPGETETAFENTYSLIQELPVSYLHVFPFSSRAGTPASRYPHKVPSKIIKTRCAKMRKLGNVKKRDFYKKFIGQQLEVLIESKRDSSTGYLKGLTSNYMPVLADGGNELENTLVKVRIDKIFSNHAVIGNICYLG